MKGTEKQIAWAEDIKGTALATIKCLRENSYIGDVYVGFKGTTIEGIAKTEAALIDAFSKIENAAQLIDMRYRFTPEVITEIAIKASK